MFSSIASRSRLSPSAASSLLFINSLRVGTPRAFSTCAPALKLKAVLEDYRRENYSRETPHRFMNDFVKAINTYPESSTIKVDTLNDFLVNIGKADETLTEEEMQLLLEEAGAADRDIPVEKVIQLMA
mmetsp:Transcript_3207/g.4692  ORF Transcript_3207/g.4692 Transcript_3207/m.4692 type:complete len:128 (+) Transcript_3207:129-512(+)|eukprot:CAMPEP_0202455980 /NCGR_PEP_ID=MMETSP1360-20130828/13358_1 /ASSEMBLY_ACC=CAM_ASM_000848 /TAXON_ID=515479 /ORGANISM="Licmophora paradoxa, Strain CCMP2313" /LENGTH=127 /DNA_ID=CAMNT_0049075677 /DNA_START=118 /DNA_END=501 /DNA_ORIENTATION=+